jgi:preprotein translocase subunit SecD
MRPQRVLILFLLGASLTATSAAAPDDQPTIERNGGTLLVYELDTSEALPKGFQPDVMVKAIKRRLDPSNLFGIRVKAAKDNRFEIGIPRRKDHDANVKLVKQLLAQAGQLEFRILANEKDDAKAIEEAQKHFTAASTDEAIKESLNQLAKAGKPPPPPQAGDGQEFTTDKGKFSYTWVEVGRGQRHTLGLDNDAEKNEERKADWLKAAEARKAGKPLVLGPDRLFLYSRDCQDERLPKEDRERKKYDYFLLCRDPQKDPKTSAPHALTGKHIVEANLAQDQGGHLAVDIGFNKEGGELLFALTNGNLPTGSGADMFYRHLAIILDRQIMIAPRLHAAIRDRAQIAGNFTATEVQRLVDFLRDGALPVPLKAVPVSETAVEPK